MPTVSDYDLNMMAAAEQASDEDSASDGDILLELTKDESPTNGESRSAHADLVDALNQQQATLICYLGHHHQRIIRTIQESLSEPSSPKPAVNVVLKAESNNLSPTDSSPRSVRRNSLSGSSGEAASERFGPRLSCRSVVGLHSSIDEPAPEVMDQLHDVFTHELSQGRQGRMEKTNKPTMTDRVMDVLTEVAHEHDHLQGNLMHTIHSSPLFRRIHAFIMWFFCECRCCLKILERLESKEAITPRLDLAVGAMISLNGLMMIVQFEYLGDENGKLLGLSKDNSSRWQHASEVFSVAEHIFATFFAVELGLRFKMSGISYLYDWGNIFDVFLVVSSIADLALTWANIEGGAARNLTILRFARLLKFVRVMRMFRMMKLFSSLRILVGTIYSSFRALIWSMVLLGLFIVVSGVCLCQLSRDFISDGSHNSDQRKEVFHFYGHPTTAAYTMFEATFSGCWPTYARPLVDHVGWGFAVFWIVYGSIVIFAVIRIVSALFLKETLQNAGNDADMMINEEIAKKQQYMRKLAEAFAHMDVVGDKDRDGALCWEEFSQVLANPRVKAYLSILDLEVHETELLFTLLDDGDGAVTFQEFIHGVDRLRGGARTLDLMCVQNDCKHLMKSVKLLQEKFVEVFGDLKREQRIPGSPTLKSQRTFPDYVYLKAANINQRRPEQFGDDELFGDAKEPMSPLGRRSCLSLTSDQKPKTILEQLTGNTDARAYSMNGLSL